MDEEDDTIEKAFKYVDINNSGCVSKTVSNVIIDIILTKEQNRKITNLRLGAVHILRQPPEGGGGVSQKLTIADKEGSRVGQFGPSCGRIR